MTTQQRNFLAWLGRFGYRSQCEARINKLQQDGKSPEDALATALDEFELQAWLNHDDVDDIHARIDAKITGVEQTIPQLAAEMGAVDMKADFQWAYHNVHLGDLKNEKKLEKNRTAPSPFAKQLVVYAHMSPGCFKHFMDQATKHLAEKESTEKQAREDDHRRQMLLIDTFCTREAVRVEKESGRKTA